MNREAPLPVAPITNLCSRTGRCASSAPCLRGRPPRPRRCQRVVLALRRSRRHASAPAVLGSLSARCRRSPTKRRQARRQGAQPASAQRRIADRPRAGVREWPRHAGPWRDRSGVHREHQMTLVTRLLGRTGRCYLSHAIGDRPLGILASVPGETACVRATTSTNISPARAADLARWSCARRRAPRSAPALSSRS